MAESNYTFPGGPSSQQQNQETPLPRFPLAYYHGNPNTNNHTYNQPQHYSFAPLPQPQGQYLAHRHAQYQHEHPPSHDRNSTGYNEQTNSMFNLPPFGAVHGPSPNYHNDYTNEVRYPRSPYSGMDFPTYLPPSPPSWEQPAAQPNTRWPSRILPYQDFASNHRHAGPHDQLRSPGMLDSSEPPSQVRLPGWRPSYLSRPSQQNTQRNSSQDRRQSQLNGTHESNGPVRSPSSRVRRQRFGSHSNVRIRSAAQIEHPNVPSSTELQALKDKLRHFLPGDLPKGVGHMCDICQKDYSATYVDPTEDEEMAIQLPCKHVFGEWCINTWFDSCKKHKNKITCPMCRKVLIEPRSRSQVSALFGSPQFLERLQRDGTGIQILDRIPREDRERFLRLVEARTLESMEPAFLARD